MGANTKDGAILTGLILARRRRRSSADLLVKNSPNAASPAVFGDWLLDAAVVGGSVDSTGTSSVVQSAALTSVLSVTLTESSATIQTTSGTFSISAAGVDCVVSSEQVGSSSGLFLRTKDSAAVTSSVQSVATTLNRLVASSVSSAQSENSTINLSLLLSSGISSYQVQNGTLVLDRILGSTINSLQGQLVSGTLVVASVTLEYNKTVNRLLYYIKPSLYIDVQTGKIVRLVGQHLIGL